MKKIALIIIIVSLILSNGYFFIKTIAVADKVLKIEKETRKLKIENAELKKTLYSAYSVKQLSAMAHKLGFTQKPQLLYIGNLKYALKYE